jgi:hypothetical protein
VDAAVTASWLEALVPMGAVAREHLEVDALREWAQAEPDRATAMREAERADWLLFLALLDIDEPRLRALVAATCRCVREALEHGPTDPRVEGALTTAERWSRGEIDRAEPRTAAAHAQAAAVGLPAAHQVVCHAAAACARAVLALERPPSWKAAIADQALRAPAQLLADRAVGAPTDDSVAAFEARREAVARARAAVHRRFAIVLRTALDG